MPTKVVVLEERLVFEAYVRNVERESCEVGEEKGSSRRWREALLVGALLVCDDRDLALGLDERHADTASTVCVFKGGILLPFSLLRHIAHISVVVNTGACGGV